MVQQMCNLQEHGGPDDEGLYTAEDAHLVLGNRRLALLDLTTAGHQPMAYSNRYFITYNGELYNFLSLKEELAQLGQVFHTHTDTEVILAAFSQWGSQSFSRFNGMFAFALWDAAEKELYLVRDAAGMKPLYYSASSSGICFASEMRALRSLPFLKEENRNWPVYLMAYGHIPEPVTTLTSVQPLKKGCFIKYNVVSGRQSLQSFKHYSYTEQSSGKAEIIHELKEKMQHSVLRHLVSDAPIGIFLSGGLDSGIIASIAAAAKKSTINTFSLFFEEKAYSEKKYQDLLLSRIDSNSFQHLLKESEFHQSFPDILADMDMPGCDGINTWFISKYAKAKGLKAVLSGIGGDELFGGYPSFSRMAFSGFLQKVPAIAINVRKKSSIKQLNRLSYLNMGGIKGVYLFLRGHFTPYEIARQLGANELEIWNVLNDLPVMNDISGLSGKNQASWMEFNLYMQNQLLRDADVMGMAHGVEIRIPFLDDELIHFATGMDPARKYAGPLRKQVLIDSFKDVLPREIWDRPKMGFSFPFAEWLRNSRFVSDIMQNSKPVTKASYEKFLAGNLHWSHLMSLIILRDRQLA
jgi:asparagine synthase (glutamine-hydrolysing)